MHLTLEPHATLIFHVLAGTLAVLSGFGALIFKKGDRLHRASGNVFFVTMLIMSSSGAFLAFRRPALISVVAGTLTFYLVATSWVTVKRAEGRYGLFEMAATVFVVCVGTYGFILGKDAAIHPVIIEDFQIPAGVYYTFGTVAFLAAVLDISVYIRRGVRGAQRIARHLWRMCTALFIAAGSIFQGNPQVFPDNVADSIIMVILSFTPLILMAFWLIRVLFTKWWDTPASAEQRGRNPRRFGLSRLP